MTLKTVTIVAMIAFAGLAASAVVHPPAYVVDQVSEVQPAAWASMHAPPGPDQGETLLAQLMYGQVPVDEVAATRPA